MRGLSTVVDTTLFLLLLGGAVTTLVVGTGAYDQPRTGGDVADETVRVLATTTATVEYELTPTDPATDGITHGDRRRFDRTAHGTTAGLLAAAARAGATMDGERLAPASGGFERAVADRIRDAIRRPDAGVAVTATWEPYRDAPLTHRLRVGPTPPATADVHAAGLSVDSGLPSVRERAVARAERDGVDGVARVLAEAVVGGLFPPDRTRAALRGGAPTDTLTAHRYRRVARLTDAPVLDIRNASVETMNRQMSEALAARLASDIERRFESPRAAAESVSVGSVDLVVRTWSA